jgi:hypothetical protein
MNTLEKNYEWFLHANLKGYDDQWVVVVDKKVVASGNDINRILTEAKEKYPKAEPLLAKVSGKHTLVL